MVRVYDRENPVTVRPADKTMSRLTVCCAEHALTVNDGITFREPIHYFLPVMIAT